MRSSDNAKSSGYVCRLDSASPREKGKSPGQHEEEEEEEEEEEKEEGRSVLKAGEKFVIAMQCTNEIKEETAMLLFRNPLWTTRLDVGRQKPITNPHDWLTAQNSLNGTFGPKRNPRPLSPGNQSGKILKGMCPLL